jgi:hypothetical protein
MISRLVFKSRFSQICALLPSAPQDDAGAKEYSAAVNTQIVMVTAISLVVTMLRLPVETE